MGELRTEHTLTIEVHATVTRSDGSPLGTFGIDIAPRVASVDTGPYAGSWITDGGSSVAFHIVTDPESSAPPVVVRFPMRDLFAAALVARDNAESTPAPEADPIPADAS